MVSNTSEQDTDGCGDFCWRQELATVATSSDATFPQMSVRGLVVRKGRYGAAWLTSPVSLVCVCVYVSFVFTSYIWKQGNKSLLAIWW